MLPDLIFRHRRPLALASFLIFLYCNLYLWLFIPFSAFDFNWRPDHLMHVDGVAADSPVAPYLQEGDHILTVDGRPARLTTVFFPPTDRQSAYELLIERDGQLLTATVPFLTQPDSYAIQHRAASAVLALIAWLVGSAVLHFSWRDNRQAIWLGAILTLSSVVVISWNATLMGVPLAWITAQPLAFLLAAGWLYLGFVPRYEPLSRAGALAFRLVVVGAIALGAVALFEGALLLPRGSSIQQWTGISLYQTAAGSQGLGGVLMLALLVVRRGRAQSAYLRQQLNILLAFVGIGFLPAILFTFLPLSLWGQPILPVPIALLGLIMVPIGYAYVVLRHAYLGLDRTLGRSAPYLVLVLLFTAAYGLSLTALENRFGDGLNLVLPAVLLFVVLAALAPKAQAGVDAWLRARFFGLTPDGPTQLPHLAGEISHQPDLATLEQIIRRVCADLNVPQSVLALKNGRPLLKPTLTLGDPAWSAAADEQWLLNEPTVRSVQARRGTPAALFAALPWAEVVVPLRAREQTLGIWVLARPRNGYIHLDTLDYLTQTAATLAMGAEIILLFDAAEKLSRQLITVQEQERRVFAARLHDEPLQQLAALRMTVSQLRREQRKQTDGASLHGLDERLSSISDYLRELEGELRTVYDEAVPKILGYGIEATIAELVNRFRKKHQLNIECHFVDLAAVDEVDDGQLVGVVYRIVLESLNNVVKHSNPTLVQVSAVCCDGEFRLTICNDGSKQPLPDISPAALVRGRHFGVVGMLSWAKLVGGSLTIQSADSSTQVRLQVALT